MAALLIAIHFTPFYQIKGQSECNEQIPDMFWESFSQESQESILNNHSIPEDIREFYYGSWSLSDDSRSFNLLDSLTVPFTRDNRALYLFLFCKICKESDGVISESIGSYCMNLLYSNPEYVLTYLYYNKDMFLCFSEYLRFEIFADDDTTLIPEEFISFKNQLHANHFHDQRAVIVRRELLQSILTPAIEEKRQ